jgi:hypothetical protein
VLATADFIRDLKAAETSDFTEETHASIATRFAWMSMTREAVGISRKRILKQRRNIPEWTRWMNFTFQMPKDSAFWKSLRREGRNRALSGCFQLSR